MKNLTITWKMSIASAIAIIIVMAINAFINIQTAEKLSDSIITEFSQQSQKNIVKYEKDHTQEQINNVSSLSDIVTTIVVPYVYNIDYDNLNTAIKMFHINGVIGIEVLDNNNKIVASSVSNSDKQQTLHVTSEAIREKKEKVGSVILYYSDTKLKQSIIENDKNTKTTIKNFYDISHQNEASAIKEQVIFSIVVIIVLIILIILMLKVLVIGPINNTIAMVKDIAEGEGDLTKRLVAKSNDEIGILSTWFNTFLEKLHSIITEVSSNTNDVNNAAHHLALGSKNIGQGINDNNDAVQMMAKSIKGISKNIQQVSSTVNESSSSAGVIAASAEEMGATINEIAQNTSKARMITESAVKQTKITAEQIGEMGQAAQDISKVVEEIEDISEQVNLLALNATIEAARAGEAGKGFAVVASEIKELAKQTAGATQDIKKRVENIQNTTQGTVNQISNIAEVVTEMNEIVTTVATAIEEQSATTSEITSNIAQMADGIEQINMNIAETNSASTKIAQDITKASESMLAVQKESQQVSLNTNSLLDLAKNLQKIVDKFKI